VVRRACGSSALSVVGDHTESTSERATRPGYRRAVFSGPVQIAYAVDDVVTAAQQWSSRGVGPFFVREHIDVHNVRVRGRPATFDHSSAYGQWGALMVELIHQHDAGADAVVGHSGIHHVAFFVEHFGIAAASLRADGCDEVLYAETATGMPFAFHDARADRGHLIEIYERTAPLDRFYRMVRDASIDWDGTDPVRML
jgi:Glyoxalase/Bleomycin resistance protein/Dioxygenase superfamily